jgi:hypothetical protein
MRSPKVTKRTGLLLALLAVPLLAGTLLLLAGRGEGPPAPSVEAAPERWPVATSERPTGPKASSPPPPSAPPPETAPATVEEKLAAMEKSGIPLVECGADGKCGECTTDSECPRGKGCVYVRARRGWRCLPSSCQTEADCAEGQRCLVANDTRAGPPIRRCLEAGALQEGEECVDPRTVETACALGLDCISGHCRLECDPKVPHPCAAGAKCVATFSGSGCVPSCASDGDCAGGQVCRPYGSYRQCVVQVRPDCAALACTPPATCETAYGPGKMAYECVTGCDPLGPGAPCAEGFVCGAYGTRSRCYQRCHRFAEVNECPSGQSCSPVMEDKSEYGCINSVQIVFPKALQRR